MKRMLRRLRLPVRKLHRPRWLVLASAGALALLLPIAILSLFFSRQTEAAWFDSGYGFRQRVAISNNNGSTLTDFQVRLSLNTATLISSGKLQSNCVDLRFTDANGKVLPHWVETGALGCNNTATGIWIKIPSIPTSGSNIYLYYGSTQAQSVSDGNRVFPVFADFTSLTTLPSNWTKTDIGTSGSVSISGGLLSISNTNGEDVYDNAYGATHAYLNQSFSGDLVAQAQVNTQSNTNDWAKSGLTIQNAVAAQTSNGMALLAVTPGNGVIFQHQTGSSTVAPNNDASTGSYTLPIQLKLVKTGSTVAGYYGTTGSSWTQQGSTIFPSGISTNQFVTLFTTPHNTGASGTATFAYFFTRKYATTEPTASLQTEEVGPTPLSYWRFEEGQGQTVKDSSGKNNNGTFGANSSTGNDDPTWISEDQCVSGKCLRLDGSNDFVKTEPISSLTTNFTVSGWVKANASAAWQTVYQSGTATNFWRVNIDSSNRLTFTKNGVADYYSTQTLAPNMWNHIEIVKSGDSGTNLTFYINGRAAGTASVGSVVTPSGTAYIGATSAGINGFVDEFRLYPYARSAAQVREDFVQGAAVLGRQEQGFLSNGLVGYWKMDEASWNGTTGEVKDASGNENHGVRVGDATTGSGKFGNGGTFDGTGDQVNFTSPVLANKSFTLSAWLKRDTVGTGDYIFTSGSSANPGLALQFGFKSNNAFTCAFYNDDLNSSSFTDTTSWHHWICTYDSTTRERKIYKDGVLFASDVAAGNFIGNTTGRIGTASFTSSNALDGNIDEFRIYERPLSPAEVASLYNYTPGPVGYWKFDEGSGSTALDASGNALNGSITSATYTPGKLGKGLQFDGDGDFVTISNNALLNGAQFTICTWAKRIGIGDAASYQILFDKQVWDDTGYTLLLDGETTGVNWRILSSNSGSTHDIKSTITTGDWRYYCGSFDGTTTKLYVDGAVVNSKSAAYATNTNDLLLGINALGEGDFQGVMDEVKIYNYARTQQQILEDMAGDALPSIASNALPEPFAHYKLDEQTGQVVTNSASGGTGYNGTLGNTSSLESDDPSWRMAATCKSNGCLGFDGSNRYAKITPTPALSTTTVSVSAWVYPTSTADSYILDSGTTNNQFSLIWYPTSATYKGFAAHFGNGSTWATSTAVASLNTWHHVLATTDGSTLKLYVDGVLMSSVAANAATSPAVWEIGSTGTGNAFTGYIDEVKVYNTVLSAEHVLLDMNSSGSVNFASTSPPENVGLSGGAGSSAVGVWELDEKNGTTIRDTSGNSNSGTITGATWTQGKVGSALEFDGDDNVVIADSTVLNVGTSDFTLQAWIRPRTLTDGAVIFSKTNGNSCSSSYGFHFATFSNYPMLHFCSGAGSHAQIQGQQVLTTEQWQHVAIVVDRDSTTNTKVYVNGRAVATTANNLASHTGSITNTLALTLGSESDGNDFWNGALDQIKIYNYARTPAQVAYDYNKGEPIGWWRMDECKGATLKDVSGNGNHGTLTVGASGSQTAIGTCSSSGTAWGNGASGKFNSGISLDGTNDTIALGSAANLTVTDRFSLGGWVKLGTNKQEFIWSRRTIGTNASTYSLIYGFSSNKFEFYADDGAYTGTSPRTALTSSVTAGDGQWHHVFWTYDGTTLRGYLDGRLDVSATKSFTLSAAAANVYLGSSTGANDFFAGQLDDMRLYAYPLSDDQVRQVFNGGAIRFGE